MQMTLSSRKKNLSNVTFPNSKTSENPEFLLRIGTKKRLTDLISDHGKAELWHVWLPGRVQNPKTTSLSFAG